MNTLRRNFPLEELIIMLRAQCPIFANRIGALSRFDNLTTPSLNLASPYLMVQKVGITGEAYNKAMGTQTRQGIVSFVICVDNTKQKGAGSGKEAVKAIDSTDPCAEQIENALLNWLPISFDLADTPLFVDEGFLGSDNTRLWQEVLWQIPFIVYNSAFKGPGNPTGITEPRPSIPFEQLAIHYSQEPIPIFLDEWIYGPMDNPPSNESVETANENANLYDANLKHVQEVAINPDGQSRGMIVNSTTDKP